MGDTVLMKTCTKCNKEYPATAEFFCRSKRYGFQHWCKICQRQYRLENSEKLTQQRHQYYEANKDKITKRQNEYNQENSERITAYKRQWAQENKERLAEHAREHQRGNPDVAKAHRKYYQANKDKYRAYKLRRRAREYALPDTYTPDQWIACLEYHNYCCAVCGCQLRDLFGYVAPHGDHWQPLVSPECPGTVAENIICLCGSCNKSKGAKLPALWLTERYGTRKANIILARIETYFAWVLSQNNQEQIA